MRNSMKYEQIEAIDWEKQFPKEPDCVQSAVKAATGAILAGQHVHTDSRKAKKIPAKKMLLLAAVITLLSGMTVVAASGLWQQRMEAMNREEMEEYFLSIANSQAPSFRYNRAMTEEERARFNTLSQQYEKEGVFPKSALTMLSTADDYTGKGIGYDKTSGTVFLPEREASDEMLLQIIDFYHKAEHSVAVIDPTSKEEMLQQVLNEEVIQTEGGQSAVNAEVKPEYQDINDEVSCYEVFLQTENVIRDIAAGKNYLYLGSETEICKVAYGSSVTEDFYTLSENEQLFAIQSDTADNVYLSLREYDADTDSYQNRLIRITAEGKAAAEYTLSEAQYDSGKTLEDTLAYEMVAAEDGTLYVKGGLSSAPVIFIFDAEGKYIEKIEADDYKTHPANGICLTQKGKLYVLGNEELLEFDVDVKSLTAAYGYWSDEMAAAVDLVYPFKEDSFYVVSYDGLFVYHLKETGSARLLAPYESGVFAEGYRPEPISENELVIVNPIDYEKAEYKITYLRLK